MTGTEGSRKFTESDRCCALELYRAGKSLRKVAAEIGASHEWVAQVVREAAVVRESAGANRLGKGLPPEPLLTPEEMVERYQSGFSVRQTAREARCGQETVRRVLVEAGLQIRGLSSAAQLAHTRMSPEVRQHWCQALSRAGQGRRFRPESIAKMAEARRRYWQERREQQQQD